MGDETNTIKSAGKFWLGLLGFAFLGTIVGGFVFWKKTKERLYTEDEGRYGRLV